MATRSTRVVLELEARQFIRQTEQAAEAMRRQAEASRAAGDAADQAGDQAAAAAGDTADALRQQEAATAAATRTIQEAAAENRRLADSHHEAAAAAGLQYDQTGRLIDSNGRVLTSAQASAHGLDTFSDAVYRSGMEAENASETASRAAAAQTAAAEEAAAAAEEYSSKQREAMETVGEAATIMGVATVAALGVATKAAMDWETAWTGVTKTVDGTPEQMAELEAGIRGLAKSLPLAHDEIAAVAEAAGQLGVSRENVLGFTKTMIDLGETTNLAADEAATNIAQIANVMGTMDREGSEGIARFGATLVALGNDGASTEKEILSMAQRIAGAGKLVGASESDVLALANTLASMGVKAELGGGVATRALLKLYAAVKSGGGELDAFAEAAGTSADEFATKFSGSPVEALSMVTKGLGRTKEEGGNVVQMLKDMGMKGTEEMQVMLALSGAGDLLTDSLELGNKAWEENTALLDEAAKRYSTTESKVTVAWNNIKDAAIDAGAVMLPVVSTIAENIADLAEGFGNLPAPVQGMITSLGGIVGVAALVGGGVLTMLPKIRDTSEAFRTLNTRADGSSRGLGKMAAGLGALAVAGVAAEGIKQIYNSMQPAQQTTEDFTQALIGLEKQASSIDEAFASIDFGGDNFEGRISNAGEALKILTDQSFSDALNSFGATALGVENGTSKIISAFENQDKAIASAVSSGNVELAQKGFKAIADSAKEQGVELEDVAKRFPEYMASLKQLASDAGESVEDMDLLNWAMGQTPDVMAKAAAGSEEVAAAMGGLSPKAQAAAAEAAGLQEELEAVGVAANGSTTDLVKFTDALFAAGLINLSARDAARGYQESIDAMTQSVLDNGTTLDINTEKGRANEAALDAIASSGYKVIQANAENGASQEELQGSLSGTYDALIVAADQLGITGDAATDLAREVLSVPDNVDINTWMSDQAVEMAKTTTGAVDGLNFRLLDLHKTIQSTPDKTITITEPMSPEVILGLENLGYIVTHLPDGTIQVGETGTDATGAYIDNVAGRQRIATIDAQAATAAAESALNYAARPRSASLTLIVGERPEAPAGIAIPSKAGGGDLDSAPGPVGVDSKLFYGAKGEHVLTAGEVRAMGGQQAVYNFRSQLRSGGIPRHATGGAMQASRQLVSYAPSAATYNQDIDYAALADAVVQAAQSAPVQAYFNLDKRQFGAAVAQAHQFNKRR